MLIYQSVKRIGRFNLATTHDRHDWDNESLLALSGASSKVGWR